MSEKSLDTDPPLSIHTVALPLLRRLVEDQPWLGLEASVLENGTRLLEVGVGGLEAGRRIAELCMAGLGVVSLANTAQLRRWPWQLCVHSARPVLACLASQYAGWSLEHELPGQRKFRALGSGPARALGSKEPLFDELGYRDRATESCMILESDQRPPAALATRIAERCGLAPECLTLILTPTSSLPGMVQVVARVLEVALHKVHALGFPLASIVDGMGSAPLCPPSPDFLTAMGRGNDAILCAGQVQLQVRGGDDEARALAENLPSSVSRDYGRPFARIFQDVDCDFYQVDPMLFSPAVVSVVALESGNTFHAGALDETLLEQSFGGTGG